MTKVYEGLELKKLLDDNEKSYKDSIGCKYGAKKTSKMSTNTKSVSCLSYEEIEALAAFHGEIKKD